MESRNKMSAFHNPVLVRAIQEPEQGCCSAMSVKFELHEKLSPMIVLAMVHAMAVVVEVGVIPVVPVELD